MATWCACCKEFYGDFLDRQCRQCPISIRTGEKECRKTPYGQAADIWWDKDGDERVGAPDSEEFKQAAAVMLTYLRETLRMVEAGEVAP